MKLSFQLLVPIIAVVSQDSHQTTGNNSHKERRQNCVPRLFRLQIKSTVTIQLTKWSGSILVSFLW